MYFLYKKCVLSLIVNFFLPLMSCAQAQPNFLSFLSVFGAKVHPRQTDVLGGHEGV